MATFTAEDGEAIYALHARSIITNFLKPAQHAKPTSLSLAKPIIPSPPKATDVVGILGAGVGGLYTALMLESLKINFEILEASEDRVGGRMYTHKFDKGGRYDYYVSQYFPSLSGMVPYHLYHLSRMSVPCAFPCPPRRTVNISRG